MHRGGGVAVRKTFSEVVFAKRSGADLISVAGHSPWLHQTPIEGRCSLLVMRRTVASAEPHARETLLCPHPGLLKASGLCPKTLLVSFRLGGGAATGHLVTHHQEDERERPSNHGVRLGVLCPEGPVQSVLYIRKTPLEGFDPLVAS